MHMNLKRLFIINALVLGTSGIFAVVVPVRVCAIYGVDINPEVLMMSQVAGLGSIAVGLVALFARKIRDPLALRGLTLAFFITHGAGALISIQNTISGLIELGWLIVILYSIFTIGYAFFFFTGRYMK
jgi:hypothetical protein